MIIEELAKVQLEWNLRLNKKKSEILTAVEKEEINGIRCTTAVKYLGVRVTVDKKQQLKVSKEQINKTPLCSDGVSRMWTLTFCSNLLAV